MAYPRIKDLREDMDLTQEDVAKYLHCSQSAYNHYEKGIRDLPTSALIALSSLFNCSTDYILGISDKKKN